jgi:glycosyltransferase involved in cell wall biosynthesis
MRLVRYEGIDSGRIEVVYNGVTEQPTMTKKDKNGFRRELGIGPDDFVVGTVGRFDQIKNLPMLVKSIDKIRYQIPLIRGLMIGDGPSFNQIKELTQKIGISEFIRMPGYRPDASNLIQCMDIFVLSSVSEGTSMALLEAMAAGIPAAVTDVGGNPEVVVNDKTGWIVSSNSVKELSAAILDAATHPDKAKRFAAAGRHRFEEKFAFKKMIDRYRRIYLEMLMDKFPE